MLRIFLALIATLLVGCGSQTETMPKLAELSDTSALKSTATDKKDATAKFPDAHERPPEGWTGPVFELSQDYPQTLPSPEEYPWATIAFKTEPEKYLEAVLDYVYEGNIAIDWEVQKNPIRKWYHAPWMHWGSRGREFIHGLTHERDSEPKELAPTQTSRFQNWAVGFYNAPGGYVLGQVWADHEAPDPSKSMFPDGAVSAKLLFTAATIDEVPFLENSFEWQANILNYNSKRAPQMVRLLQIDIAVRERRTDDKTGWVFGTFIYNRDATGDTPWEKMLPVGLMWGNDPGITPEMVEQGTRLKQTWLNPEVKLEHYGWANRLNGPVDNPISSCLSCHATGQFPSSSLMTMSDEKTIEDKLRWFRNIKAGTPFDTGSISTDYSLQISAGIRNFVEARQPSFRTLLRNRSFADIDIATSNKIDDRAGKSLIIDGTLYHPINRGDN